MKDLFSASSRVMVALFFLAVLLWFFVVSNRDYDAAFSIPLNIKGLEAGYIFVQDPPKSVRITCSGRGRDLLVWRYFLGTYLELNISGLSTIRDFPLIPQMVNVPAGFPIKDLEVAEPETLRLHIDRIAEKRIPVRADCKIEPAPGFIHVGEIICEPDSIGIRGPRILVQEVDELVTQERHFTRVRESIKMRLSLESAFSPKILPQVHHVLVQATIEPLEQTSCDSVPIEVRNIPEEFQSTVAPQFIQIVIEGPQSFIRALDSLAWSVFLDYNSDWNAEQKSFIPRFEGPQLLKVVSITPPAVSWEVQKSTTRRKR